LNFFLKIVFPLKKKALIAELTCWQLTEALESSGPMQVFEISWEAVQEMGKIWDVANNCASRNLC
jgi:hypothetical protein